MNRVIIRHARADVRAIRSWFEREEKGLGNRFTNELGGAIERIARTPMQFPDVSGHFRRALLDRFPYAVYFRIRPDESIAVFGVIESRRMQEKMVTGYRWL